MNVELLYPDDSRIDDALRLAERVFMEFEAPVYPEEGKDNFLKYLYGEDLRGFISCRAAEMYICSEDDNICAMMCLVRGDHISLAFTEKAYQRKGMGRAMFEEILKRHTREDFTVNSSPFGYEFYKSLGFEPTDMELIEDGIIFTPMKRIRT